MDLPPPVRSLDERVEITISCRDCDGIPKVPDAGSILSDGTLQFQVMHNGLKVPLGKYYGEWMTRIISGLKGHHEPQEEKLFDALVSQMRPASVMLELGSFWAYYSAWFHLRVANATNYLIEPDPHNLEIGKTTFEINNCSGTFFLGCVERTSGVRTGFICESDQVARDIPQYSVDDFLDSQGITRLELLHADIQGMELPMLQGCVRSVQDGKIRFAFVSTHHHLISGDPLTHLRCIDLIQTLGGRILAEYSPLEAFSGDGLIVAAFLENDRNLALPEISRNRSHRTIFRALEYDLWEAKHSNAQEQSLPSANRTICLESVKLKNGVEILIDAEDSGPISSALRTLSVFEPEETAFLQRVLTSGDVFCDVGANIGYFTRTASAIVGAAGKVIAIEPAPANIAILKANIAACSNPDNVILFLAAASERSGLTDLFLSPVNAGDHRLFDMPGNDMLFDQGATRESIPVRTERIDTLVSRIAPSIKHIKLVKIDIQGYEVAALRGMCQILTAYRPIVLFEFWPYGITAAGYDPMEAINTLLCFDYRLHIIDSSTGSKTVELAELNTVSGAFVTIAAIPR